MELGNFLRKERQEEERTPQIKLRFFRHSKKEADKVSATDWEVGLSAEGKRIAKEKAFVDTNLSQSATFASKRLRAQHTGLLVMAGGSADITGEETLDELKEKLNKGIAVGSKLGVDSRLNFNDDEQSPLGKELYKAEERGEYLKFIVEESDRAGKETRDTTHSNYSSKAADIASVIEKYVKIVPSWKRLVENEAKGYKDVLERYLATHQGMGESFLAKLIEKTEGIEERNKFIEIVGPQGFGYVEGFEVDIFAKSGALPEVEISYSKERENGEPWVFKKKISLELLRKIIEEGNA